MPKPGSISRTSSSSILRARATAGSSEAIRPGAVLFGRGRHRRPRRFRRALAQGEEPAQIAQVLRRRELRRLPRAAPGAKAPEGSGRRVERSRPRLARARFRVVLAAKSCAVGPRRAPAFPGRRRDGGSRRGWSRAPAGGGALCLGRVPDLMRGLQDKEAVARVSARVAELTGLDPTLVRRLAGRIDRARSSGSSAQRGTDRLRLRRPRAEP